MKEIKDISDCLILAVDDAELNLDILSEALSDDYEFAVAIDGPTALKFVANSAPDMILLDIMMPGMDGFQVLERLKGEPATADIPVIILSALSDVESKAKGLELGAVDYLSKPFEMKEVRARVRTHLSLLVARRQLARQNEILEERVRERTRELIGTQQAAMESLASLAEHRDPETGGHISRIKNYVYILAKALVNHPNERLRLTPQEAEQVTMASPLHDIGKVGVPDHILFKNGPLTPEEMAEMQRHVEYGRGALESAERSMRPASRFLRIAKELVASHHERWDGKGYPEKLAGDAIPLWGRIMSIADVYDALVCARVYKPPFSHEDAVRMMTTGRGTQFDPELTDLFLSMSDKFLSVAQRFAEKH